MPTTSTRPDAARRRDGLTLAATGTIPDRVRAQVLADYRADLSVRARAGVRARIETDLLPLPIPYGYRRSTDHATRPADNHARAGDEPASRPPGSTDPARTGRAPARLWTPDRNCASTVVLMAWWLRGGMTPTDIATRLDTTHSHPPLLTLTGQQQRWTARRVAAVLTDHALTGRTVWARTRHRRPRPRSEWIVSTNLTHPPILGADTIAEMAEILATATDPRPLDDQQRTGGLRRPR